MNSSLCVSFNKAVKYGWCSEQDNQSAGHEDEYAMRYMIKTPLKSCQVMSVTSRIDCKNIPYAGIATFCDN